jgi:SAM-dependent methyltransferase
MTPPTIRRLHWGCGSITPPDWINSDIVSGPGVQVCGDIRQGLPLENGSLDYIVSQHGLQDLGIYEQVDALRELWRLLKPGGVLRLGLPDLDLAIAAYQRGNREYFLVQDWESISGNFVSHVLWYNLTRTPFTREFAQELLRKAGFREVFQLAYRETRSAHPGIVDLDSRPAESFFVEAVK